MEHRVACHRLVLLRAQDEADGRIVTLAAFKESSGIEYGADLGILLRSVPGENNKVVDVSIAKSRLGENEVTIRLERGSHLRYREVPIPEVDERCASGEANDARFERKVLDAIRGGSLKSANEVCEAVGGNRQRTLQAFKRLVAQDRIVSVGGVLRVAVPGAERAPTESKDDQEPPSDVTPRNGGSGGSTGSGTTGTRSSVVVPLVPRPEGAEPGNHNDHAGGDPLTRAKAAIVSVLRAHPGVPNVDGVRLYIGRDFPAWKLRLAWIDLCRGGDLENQGTARAPSWRVAVCPGERAPPA